MKVGCARYSGNDGELIKDKWVRANYGADELGTIVAEKVKQTHVHTCEDWKRSECSYWEGGQVYWRDLHSGQNNTPPYSIKGIIMDCISVALVLVGRSSQDDIKRYKILW